MFRRENEHYSTTRTGRRMAETREDTKTTATVVGKKETRRGSKEAKWYQKGFQQAAATWCDVVES